MLRKPRCHAMPGRPGRDGRARLSRDSATNPPTSATVTDTDKSTTSATVRSDAKSLARLAPKSSATVDTPQTVPTSVVERLNRDPVTCRQ